MEWWTVPALAVGLPTAYFAVKHVGQGMLSAYDAVYRRHMVAQMDRLILQEKANAIALKNWSHLQPDERGRIGVLTNRRGAIFNFDTGTVLDGDWNVVRVDPERERMEHLIRLLEARAGTSGGDAQDLLPEAVQAQLPSQIGLMEALGMHTPSLDALLVGVTLDETGKTVPIYRSIYQLMHLLSVGRTGAGKSSWMLSFLAQLDMCKQDMEIILVDVHGAAFNVCQDWSALRYPVARNNQQAKCVFQKVIDESERRDALFQEVPLAKDLASYNANVEQGQELAPWITVIDEGTLMLSDSSISHFVAQCVQGTRQYGMYVFMTGQTGNASVVKSEIRGNFPTRVCYTTEKAMMSAALGESPPSPLPDIPGRAWARLISRQEPYMIQSPYIRHDEFYRMLDHNGPRLSMPEASKSDSSPEWTEEYLWKVWDGLPTRNQSELCKALWLDAGKDPDKVSGAPGGSWSRDVRNAALRAELPIKTRKRAGMRRAE